MATDNLWKLSASDLSNRIAKGEVSAREAVGSAVARMHAKNPELNAVVDDLSDTAMARAAALDEELARSGPVGPLHGVPVTIKVNVDQKGRANTNGLPALKDFIAPDDAPIVKNLERAGAVVIGRTNTPEFSMRGTTVNPLHGRTYNPWDEEASPGGSSGGASSAVMSGIGAIAHGNDILGSLRFPATATGASTVKPGLGRVPAYNPSQTAERGLLAQLMSTQGAICREVRDVRLAMQAMIAPDPHCPWHVPMGWDGPAIDGPIKVAFTRNDLGFSLDPAVDAAVTTARDALIDAGYQVEEVDLPPIRETSEEAARALNGEFKALVLGDIRKLGSDEVNAIFDNMFDIFPPYEGDELIAAFARRSHFVRQWMLFLQDYPLVLTPFLLSPIFSWNRDAQGREGLEDVLGKSLYSFAFNYMGLPAGNVPANYNDGLPVGVQIVGRRFREDMILDACEAIETRVGVMADRLFKRG